MPKLKYTKNDRLINKKIIQQVLKKGKSVNVFPFYVKYLQTDILASSKTKIIFSIPKKKIKKAVNRNKLKRRCREAFRLNRITENNQTYTKIIFIYTDTNIATYKTIELSINITLSKIF